MEEMHHFGPGICTPKSSWEKARSAGVTDVDGYVEWVDAHPEHLILLSAEMVKKFCMAEMAEGNPKALPFYLCVDKMQRKRASS